MKARKILIFLACVMALLAVVALIVPEGGIKIAGLELRYPTMRSVLQSVRERQRSINTVNNESPEMAALRDSVNYYTSLVDSSDMRFWLPSEDYFDAFWQAAETAQQEGRTLRILHYGDSQIEMDHITSHLRRYMQGNFGGGGPGMLPVNITTPNPNIHLGSAGELTHLASFGDSNAVRSNGNYGPMMQCFRLDGTLALSLHTSNHKNIDDAVKRFNRLTLVYNNLGGKMTATATDSHTASEKGISSATWQTDSTDRIKLRISGNVDLYAMMLDCGSGIAVDNIPMRGCSGQQFTLVNEDKLTAAYKQMDIGLIILQFGGNSVPYIKDTDAVVTYCHSLGRQIDHVHRCCPDAKILFVGPSDMGRRSGGQFKTYPMLPLLVDSLTATALEHGAAYWSIYHAMGGENSMSDWVAQGYAGKDYIHFSQRGADLMGDRLAEAFANSHTLYTLRQRLAKGGGE